MTKAGYRKINDGSRNSSKFHKLDGKPVRAILKGGAAAEAASAAGGHETEFNGYAALKSLTGQDFVYPGHPLVVATLIMCAYPNFLAANAPTEHGFSEALGDNRIPGAGCHVGAAMSALSRGSNAAGIDAMVAFANDYWDRGQAGGLTKYVAAGQEQARLIEPHFRELAAVWFGASQ